MLDGVERGGMREVCEVGRVRGDGFEFGLKVVLNIKEEIGMKVMVVRVIGLGGRECLIGKKGF